MRVEKVEVNELFKRYKETGDIALRNQIAEKYLYIADILAKKFVGRGVEYDDLKQVASLALLRGIDRFDPDLGMQFTTFITPTITGEIKNYFRDKSRMVKLPRRLGEISVAVKKYSAQYESEKGIKPSVKQIAIALKLTEEEVVNALEIGGVVSLDSMASSADDENETSLYSLLGGEEDGYERFEIKEVLKSAMRDFSDTEKALVKYRYFDELSQSETAKRLGVSQMFVSRMERKLLSALKEKLKNSI
ncbi:MAG: sigma-70 family RNA polymerase sigma factor [Clostridia bacterium]|nr:sigma-70 family RNA polymerase sigma factor [Clostridia bacterium]